jgi:hypothetical protein
MRRLLFAVLIAASVSVALQAPAQAAAPPPVLGPDHKLLNGGRPAEHVAFPAIRNWPALKITLARTRCFGSCPAYTVEIGGDGRVSYLGQAFVGVKGEAGGRISRAQVRRLYDAFRKAQFFWLQDGYVAQVTDLPSTRIAISFDGRSKQVIDYAGVGIGMPREVVDLETLIDAMAGTEKWIKGGETESR